MSFADLTKIVIERSTRDGDQFAASQRARRHAHLREDALQSLGLEGPGARRKYPMTEVTRKARERRKQSQS